MWKEQVGDVDIEDANVVDQETDSDVEVLEVPTPMFKTPKKKQYIKVKERLDDSFLRRSKRIANKLGASRTRREPARQKKQLKMLILLMLLTVTWLRSQCHLLLSLVLHPTFPRRSCRV